LPPPVPVPFPIGDREKADLARVLKLDGLQPELCDAISHAWPAAGSVDSRLS
jgi:hypothetical protein